MANNIYRFRRIKWGAPQKLNGVPAQFGRRSMCPDLLIIVIGVVAIGALLSFIF